MRDDIAAMAANPRQHYLPARFLARFSVDPNPDPRRRTLFVGQRPPGRTFQTVAERAGFVRGLYDDQLDEIWQGYEGPLPGALDQLSDGDTREIDAETWLRVLVPFAAALLLRGPDFEERFAERPVIKALGDRMQGRPDPRPFELQRLLAPVLAARWLVIHTQEDELLLTSDTGWAPFIEPTRKRVACAIPLDTRTVLALVPNAIRTVFVWNTSRWMTPVQQVTLAKDDYHIFRQNLADFASRQVFGPSSATIESVRENLDASPGVRWNPFHLLPSGVRTDPLTSSPGIDC